MMLLLLLIIIIILDDDDDDDGIVSVCLSASLIDDHTKSFGYHTKSNCMGDHYVHYVTLQIKLDEEK
jgi:hypothetical protein